jgi:hypothetical protein
MHPRIHTMLAFAVGLVAFALLSLMPTGLVAAATQSGFVMQKTDGTPEIWLTDSTGVALGFDFDLPGPTGSGWKIVGVGDFDGDGNPDVLWQNADGTPAIWFLSGTDITQMVPLTNPGSSWKIVGVGDFNGDGKADILWRNSDGTPGIWLMSGATPISQAGLVNPGSAWKIVGVGDFNGDGKADILWQYTDGTPGIWLMNGTTPIAMAGLSNPGSGWKPVATGDFNSDGRSDIVWQYTDGTPSIWLMNGTSYTATIGLTNPGSQWKIIAAGDFNGDGQADILWQSTDGPPGIWLMNGTTPSNETGLKNPGTSWQIMAAGAFGAAPPLPVQANDGHVQITAVGGTQTVFNHTTDACNPTDPLNDQPDSSYFAFRSADGTVTLTGNDWPTNYRMVGPSLDSVQRSCAPTYVSAQDQVYPDFKDFEWLAAAYTLDGTTVYALTHNEWDPQPPPCNDGSFLFGITLLVSTDGGATYTHPSNYKIAVPPAYNGSCPVVGYGFSNIIAKDGYYYAFFIRFGGTCIMRTTNLADASSWQTLVGGSWQSLPAPLSAPAQCDLPQAPTNSEKDPSLSLTYSTYLNAYVALIFGVPGLWYSTSTDLVNWSPPQSILAYSPGGVNGLDQVNGLTLLYGSFLDPTDSSRNFENIGQQPYLYLTYEKPNGDRDVIRQQIRFTLN